MAKSKLKLPKGALNGERYRIFISTDAGGWDDDDYPKLIRYSNKYPSPAYYRAITKQGAKDPYFYCMPLA